MRMPALPTSNMIADGRAMRRLALLHALAMGMTLAQAGSAPAQDMMRHLDLASPAMTQAEMTRSEVERLIRDSAGRPDLGGRRLSGLDLSGLDFHGANLRAAVMNKVKLSG